MRLSRLSEWGVDPVVKCCRLPPTYFWTTWHQTRAFLISVINKKWFIWLVFTILKNGEAFGHCRWIWGWSRCCTPPEESCRVPPTYLWTTWHQTRAFLISVINKSDRSGWFDNSKKGEVSGQIEWTWGWSRGCTPPQECCRIPPTYFWATWQQTRAFMISVMNIKWFLWLAWQFWKRRGVWADCVDVGLIARLHSISGMLQTTAYLLLGHMAPN